jgi:hypothetical protein
MIKLDVDFQVQLLKQPESGMGYQIVEAVTSGYKTKRGIAYNAELLLFDEEPRVLLKFDYKTLLAGAKVSKDEIRSLHIVTGATSTASAYVLKETSVGGEKKNRPAKDALIEMTKDREVFKRFSAYENDRRITSNGSLLPGTYATTEEDAQNAPTGKAAVARYALPNPKPASNVFTIKPRKDTLVQYGIVEPANGQPGGGVEVIFTTGTHAGTVTGPEKIPDE